MFSDLIIIIFKNRILGGLLFLLIFTVGCGQRDKEIYQDSWKDDVLLSQECGLSGLSCCFDKENKCEQGLECCLDPNDQSKGYCGEGCGYGQVSKYCRKDEPRCDGTAICVDNYCAECGVTGNPCCAENKCADQNKKDEVRAECLSGICTLCGASGEASCPSDFKCSAGNLNNGGFCHRCGGSTQPCCNSENSCEKGLECKLGFCS